MMRRDRSQCVYYLVLIVALAIGCRQTMAQNNSPLPKRDINEVLADHQKELMAIPGVVGVYVGVLKDGRTPCLKVMLAEQTKNRAIPSELEGYPVVTEVTGEIRPLRTP
jgi:hypothetical protein